MPRFAIATVTSSVVHDRLWLAPHGALWPVPEGVQELLPQGAVVAERVAFSCRKNSARQTTRQVTARCFVSEKRSFAESLLVELGPKLLARISVRYSWTKLARYFFLFV
jgi:hypothetical protein